MATRTWTALMLAPLAISIAIGYAGTATAASKDEEAKELKPVRVKAPPRPSVKTNIAPGTWDVPRHKGNSPKFRPDREKDWVDPTGGKKPVRTKK